MGNISSIVRTSSGEYGGGGGFGTADGERCVTDSGSCSVKIADWFGTEFPAWPLKILALPSEFITGVSIELAAAEWFVERIDYKYNKTNEIQEIYDILHRTSITWLDEI